MTVLVDTSVFIDYLRGHPAAADLLQRERLAVQRLHSSEITRLEILAGMRATEEEETRSLLGTIVWHPLDADIAEDAGTLGRRWLPSHSGIDSADLAVAATTLRLGARLLTGNVRNFPMFPGLQAPY